MNTVQLTGSMLFAILALLATACGNTNDSPQNIATPASGALPVPPTSANASATESSPRPITPSPATTEVASSQSWRDPTSTKLDSPSVEEAVKALKKMADQANDSALATDIPYLSRKPERGYPARGDDYDFAAGLWKMRLDNRTWIVAVFQQDGSMWFYSGKFQRDKAGDWEAVLTTKEGAPSRGGR